MAPLLRKMIEQAPYHPTFLLEAALGLMILHLLGGAAVVAAGPGVLTRHKSPLASKINGCSEVRRLCLAYIE